MDIESPDQTRQHALTLPTFAALVVYADTIAAERHAHKARQQALEDATTRAHNLNEWMRFIAAVKAHIGPLAEMVTLPPNCEEIPLDTTYQSHLVDLQPLQLAPIELYFVRPCLNEDAPWEPAQIPYFVHRAEYGHSYDWDCDDSAFFTESRPIKAAHLLDAIIDARQEYRNHQGNQTAAAKANEQKRRNIAQRDQRRQEEANPRTLADQLADLIREIAHED